MTRRLTMLLAFGLLLALLVPASSLALAAPPAPHLVLPVAQIWVVLVAVFTPLIGYITNTALWKSAPEPVKAFVQVVIAAVASAITAAISTNVFGLNSATLQLIITGVLTALGSHALLWKPSGVQAHLTSRA